MGDVVSYLNSMNALYAEDPGRDFVWSGVENNCTHLAVNALARLSELRELRTDTGWGRRLFHLAIPANVFVELATRGNAPLDPEALFDDPDARAAFLEHDWVLQQPGTLVRFLPRFRENNHMWEGDFDFYTMERPVLPLIAVPGAQLVPIGSKWVWPPFYRFEQKRFRRLFADSVATDLGANLRRIRARYDRETARADTTEFWRAYAAYIETQRRLLDAASASPSSKR